MKGEIDGFNSLFMSKERWVCPDSSGLVIKRTELQILQIRFDAHVIEVVSKIVTIF